MNNLKLGMHRDARAIAGERLTIRIGVSVFVPLMLLVARALRFDVPTLLRQAMQFVR